MHGLVQFCLCQQLLEAGIFRHQLPQALRLGNLHAAVFGLPAVETLLGNTALVYQVGHLGASLMRLEYADDLLFVVAFALYVETSLRSI